jgi:hypothetical protein
LNAGGLVYAFEMRDKFTHYGVVSVVIVSRAGVFEQFVMSCRARDRDFGDFQNRKDFASKWPGKHKGRDCRDQGQPARTGFVSSGWIHPRKGWQVLDYLS